MIDESKLIERLVNNQMNKSKAVDLARQHNLTTLTNTNTIFSNLVYNYGKWWLEPSNDKFKNALNIILNNDESGNLYIFQIPADSIKNAIEIFKQRNDSYRKNCSDIYIPLSDSSFIEQNGFDFGLYLKKIIPYDIAEL